MSDFSQSDLQNLWIQAGGDSAIAPLMSAIAMAESGGNSDATNADGGACGLWQIYPCEQGALDPFTNAQIAVRKYKTQGLKAWVSYTNGAYKQFYQGSSAPQPATLLSSTSGGCATTQILGNCADGWIGLTALILGIALMVAPLLVAVLNTNETKQVVKLGVKAATLIK